MTVSDAMKAALGLIRDWSRSGTYMPRASAERTFEALQRRGLVEWRSVDNGSARNGYALTEAGRAILEAQPLMET